MIGRGRKHNDDYFNTANGWVSADYAMPINDLYSQIQQIRDAFPDVSKETAAIVLQSCDCNLEKAVTMISQDGGAQILSSWNFQRKKGKNGYNKTKSRRKKNKKKNLNERNAPKLEENIVNEPSASMPQNSVPNGDASSECGKVESIRNVDATRDKVAVAEESSPSSRKSSISLKSENPSLPPTPLPQSKEKVMSFPTNGVPSKAKETTKKEINVIESMPRSTKDLHRSAVAIARFHLVHQERCSEAEKRIKTQFKRMRDSVSEREKFLLEELENIRIEAANMLEERQHQAANLKLQCDQIGRLRNLEVQELRAEIKRFVGDRKIDEELANTERFTGDCDQIIKAVESFGHISPLKADYKARSSSLTTQISTDAEITPRDSLAEPVDDVFLAKEQGTSGATPDKPTHKSLSCAELKERAEDHNKLIEAIHKQSMKDPESNSTALPQERAKHSADRNKGDQIDKQAGTAEKGVNENENKTEQQKVGHDDKGHHQKQQLQPQRYHQERQQNQSRNTQRNNGSGKDRYNSEWRFDAGYSDTVGRDRRSDQKRQERPWRFDADYSDTVGRDRRSAQKRQERPFDDRRNRRHGRKDQDTLELNKSAKEDGSNAHNLSNENEVQGKKPVDVTKIAEGRDKDKQKDASRAHNTANRNVAEAEGKKPVDVTKIVEERDKEKQAVSSKSNETENSVYLKGNNTKETKDVSKIEGNKSQKEATESQRSQRSGEEKERRDSGSRGNNFNRNRGNFRRNNNRRQNGRGNEIEKPSNTNRSWRGSSDVKQSESEKKDAEKKPELISPRDEKMPKEKQPEGTLNAGITEVPVEPKVVEKVKKNTDRMRQDSHNQRHCSSEKPKNSSERLPQRNYHNRRRNYQRTLQEKGEKGEDESNKFYKNNDNDHPDKTKRSKSNPQRTVENVKAEDVSKKIQQNAENEARHAPKQDPIAAKKSWADEETNNNEVQCNGHME